MDFKPDYSFHLPGPGFVENNASVAIVKMATADGVLQANQGVEVVVCLVLREVGGTQGGRVRYERIGLAHFAPSVSKDWFEDAEIMTVEIV
jgi:hypothetical protein